MPKKLASVPEKTNENTQVLVIESNKNSRSSGYTPAESRKSSNVSNEAGAS